MGFPNWQQRRSMMPVMRLMLLFWLRMKLASASHPSCRRTRMPPAKRQAGSSAGIEATVRRIAS